MKVSDLKGNPRNPRKISDKKLEMLKKSLSEFGDLSGVVFNKTTGHLVGGHQRMKVIPRDAIIEMVDGEHGFISFKGQKQAYREVSWDETKEKAANIAANKHGGEFDLPSLSEWLLELDAANIDMELTGFELSELEDLMAPVQTLDPQCDEDEVPEVKEEPKTKRGDIYILGRHRLMCGDSTSIDDVENLMAGARADITFTSPPYNAAKNGHLTGQVAGFDKKYKEHSDELSDDDFLGLLCGFTSIAVTISNYCFVNIQLLTHNRVPLFKYQEKFQSLVKDVLIWNKKQCPPNIVKGAFNTKWEYVFCFSEDNRTRGFPCEWRGQFPNVIETESNSGNEFAEDHKAGFPVAFPSWFIEKFDFAKSIYEPFCGTGTTIIAAEKFGRACYGMELDPHYCDVIVARWEKYTGKKSELVSG